MDIEHSTRVLTAVEPFEQQGVSLCEDGEQQYEKLVDDSTLEDAALYDQQQYDASIATTDHPTFEIEQAQQESEQEHINDAHIDTVTDAVMVVDSEIQPDISIWESPTSLELESQNAKLSELVILFPTKELDTILDCLEHSNWVTEVAIDMILAFDFVGQDTAIDNAPVEMVVTEIIGPRHERQYESHKNKRLKRNSKPYSLQELDHLASMFPQVSQASIAEALEAANASTELLANALRSCGGNVEQAVQWIVEGKSDGPRKKKFESKPAPSAAVAARRKATTAPNRAAVGKASLPESALPTIEFGFQVSNNSTSSPTPTISAAQGHPNQGSVSFSFSSVQAAVKSRRGLLDPDKLRAQAIDVFNRRGETFNRAATSFQRGGLTGKATAAVYAADGRDLSITMQRINDQAAFAHLVKNSISHGGDPDILDLHYLTTSEAKRAAQEYVETWIAAKRSSRYAAASGLSTSKMRLKVIVGAGNHSTGGVSRLGSAVRKHLES
eukprot:jgi/Hompol1/5035/HPOL_004112-RA